MKREELQISSTSRRRRPAGPSGMAPPCATVTSVLIFRLPCLLPAASRTAAGHAAARRARTEDCPGTASLRNGLRLSR